MKSNKEKCVFIIIILLTVGASILVFYFKDWRSSGSPAVSPVSPATTLAKPQYASPGQLAPGFPSELILDSGAQLGLSYSINYDPSTNQYTASFKSKESMESLFSSYKKYLGDNGWNITNEITKYPTSRGLYAVKGAADASVAIIKQTEGSEVVVSYLSK